MSCSHEDPPRGAKHEVRQERVISGRVFAPAEGLMLPVRFGTAVASLSLSLSL